VIERKSNFGSDSVFMCFCDLVGVLVAQLAHVLLSSTLNQDTIKTCMQGDIERVKYGNFVQTGSKIWSESSLPGFYRGATFRYGRMVCAVFIMDLLKEKVAYALYPSAFAT
jgi:Mitochondrial carrier protein